MIEHVETSLLVWKNYYTEIICVCMKKVSCPGCKLSFQIATREFFIWYFAHITILTPRQWPHIQLTDIHHYIRVAMLPCQMIPAALTSKHVRANVLTCARTHSNAPSTNRRFTFASSGVACEAKHFCVWMKCGWVDISQYKTHTWVESWWVGVMWMCWFIFVFDSVEWRRGNKLVVG